MRRFSSTIRRARPLLGTLVEIAVYGDRFMPAMQSAFAAVERVHRLMSRQESASEVAHINRAAPGSIIELDPWTYEVLERARELNEITGGLFDCGLVDAQLCGRNVIRLPRRIAVTLDGIAKGYAVDRAVEALRANGVPAGRVNAGGDLRVFGEAPEPIHIRHPALPGRLACIGHVRNAAVASSALNGCGATVIAADCLTADALTKPCLLAPRRSRAIARRFAAHAFWIDKQGRIH